jgi:glycosyltransferase involved in cell wall biosynthesis
MYQQIDELGLRAKILLSHDLSVNELKQAIRRAHAVVIPSYSEGFCFAAVETMALDVPLITSGRGALSEVVGGKHIHADNLTIVDLCAAMERAINNDWAYHESVTYPIQDTVRAYIAAYQKLLSE